MSAQPEAVARLVPAAQAGDPRAVAELVAAFDRQLRAVAASFRLQPADVDDVMQITWMRLLQRIHQLQEPAAIGGWLATTVRRECLRTLQRPMTEELTAEHPSAAQESAERPDDAALRAERRATLRQAMGALPDRHRRLMVLLAAEPELEYRRIGAALDMPVGSIGPIRARCLDRLRRDGRVQALRG
jgi:RNA polymerase sigma factor (sigma-70 family)